MASEKFTTRVAEMWIDDDDISHLVFLPESEITLDDAIEIVKTSYSRNPGKRYVLTDARGLKSITHEARDFFAGASAEQIKYAEAIVVGPTPSRLFVNFFINVHKPKNPAKIFTSEKEAIAWLKSLMKSKK